MKVIFRLKTGWSGRIVEPGFGVSADKAEVARMQKAGHAEPACTLNRDVQLACLATAAKALKVGLVSDSAEVHKAAALYGAGVVRTGHRKKAKAKAKAAPKPKEDPAAPEKAPEAPAAPEG